MKYLLLLVLLIPFNTFGYDVVTQPNEETLKYNSLKKELTVRQCTGENYVYFAGECIKHTDNCEIHFGKNILGEDFKGINNVSACTCEDGYEFVDRSCQLIQVEPIEEPEPIVEPEPEPVIEKIIVPVPVPTPQPVQPAPKPVVPEPVVEEPVEEETKETPEPVVEPTPEPVEVIPEEPKKPNVIIRVFRWFFGLF